MARQVVLSAASVWEIAIKYSLGKLRVSTTPTHGMSQTCPNIMAIRSTAY